MRYFTSFCFGICLLFGAWDTYADNYNPRLLGSRSSGMGGASIAAVDDSSAGLMNPAGLSRIDGNVFSLSVAAYSFDAYRYDNFFVRDEPTQWRTLDYQLAENQVRSDLVDTRPASLMYIAHGDLFSFGFSVLVPYSEARTLEGGLQVELPNETTDAEFSIIRNETIYYIGPSIAFALGDGSTKVRFGLSAFYVYGQSRSIFNSYVIASNIRGDLFSTLELSASTTGNSHSLLFVSGIQADFGPLSIGAMIQSPSIPLGGYFDTNLATSIQGAPEFGTQNTITTAQLDGSFEIRQPLRVGFGTSLSLGVFTLAVDGSLVLPSDHSRFDGDRYELRRELGEPPVRRFGVFPPAGRERSEQPVLNGAIGLEVAMSSMIKLRGGAFTSISSTKLGDGSELAYGVESIDRFGGTLGLGVGFRGLETAITFAYIGGEGEAIGFDIGSTRANPTNRRRVDSYQSSFVFLISGTVNIRTFLSPSSSKSM